MSTEVASTIQTTLPDSMVIVAFALSLLLTVFKIIELISRYIKAPELSVSLTKEAFLRCNLSGSTGNLNNDGEVLFANAVLLAKNEAVLVRNVNLNLKKLSGSKKDFPLPILYYGEKVKSQGNFADHNFVTTSPLSYIPKDTPQRVVYFSVIQEYAERIRQKAEKFAKELEGFNDKLEVEIKDVSDENRYAFLNNVHANAENMSTQFTADIMELIQLEGGDYRLEVMVEYQNPKGIFGGVKSSESAIEFKVSKDFRDIYRSKIKQWASTVIANKLLNKMDVTILPDYCPYQFEEIVVKPRWYLRKITLLS